MNNFYNPPFRSEIYYSVQNEDYRSELSLLQHIYRGEPLRVLLIASAGENALSLLTQEIVASVDAVDLNPAQLHLCEMRRTATLLLDRDEQLRLFGADPAYQLEEDREARHELFDRIKTAIPEPARTFWQIRRDQEIAFGIQHVGRNDVGMHDIYTRLRQVGFEPLVRPLQDDELELWQSVYTAIMNSSYILELFGLPSEALASKISGIAWYMGQLHFKAVQQPGSDRNYFVTTVFKHYYATRAGEEGLPIYLQKAGQQALRLPGRLEQLKLHQGNLLEKMVAIAEGEEPFDLISISNIADWMSEDDLRKLVVRAKGYIKPGGAFLARALNPAQKLADALGHSLILDSEFNSNLPEIERGPWFRQVVAGFNPD